MSNFLLKTLDKCADTYNNNIPQYVISSTSTNDISVVASEGLSVLLTILDQVTQITLSSIHIGEYTAQINIANQQVKQQAIVVSSGIFILFVVHCVN